jgi:Dimerisation and cyclophilin-binding domain of Mon2
VLCGQAKWPDELRRKAHSKGSRPLLFAPWFSEIISVLRLAIETRKPPVVELALDLIQKLIAHQHLQGRVYSISSRHDGDRKALPKAKRAADEDAEEANEDGALPPQVAIQLCSAQRTSSSLVHKPGPHSMRKTVATVLPCNAVADTEQEDIYN